MTQRDPSPRRHVASSAVASVVGLSVVTVLLATGIDDGRAGLLAGLGFAGAMLAGLVGVGGAVIMIPLLAYAPQLVGMTAIGMRTITGITLVHVLAAAATGTSRHLRAALSGPISCSAWAPA